MQIKNVKLLFLLAVIAAGVFACGDDKTELSWTRKASGGGDIDAIVWKSTNDVSWSDTLTAPNQTTASKEISDDSLNGFGRAAWGGIPGDIVTPEGKNLTLSSGHSQNYEISSVSK